MGHMPETEEGCLRLARHAVVERHEITIDALIVGT